ncbi:MAG: 1,2-phenylacetyl-CoA epoxidase subunit PaaC [Ferruginibacter sp.]
MIQYVLHLADNNLILAQRNAEWCAHGPILEQDIAITNITLDQIGQARLFYQHAAELINATNSDSTATEDSLAYLRNESEFNNILMLELPKGNWAFTTLRQYLYSTFQYFLYSELLNSTDSQVSAIAEKSLKEIIYHVKWSGEWVLRLGDGTEVSHDKMQEALNTLWPYTGEFFDLEDYEEVYNIESIKKLWLEKVTELIHEATLTIPENVFMQKGGKKGLHTEYMGFILAEMQTLQRSYPGATW